jgi:hypothetical protein
MHSVFCLTTGPKPLPKRFLHIVRSRASSFKWEYTFLSLRSASSFLRLLPRLLVTSISPFNHRRHLAYMISLFLERDYPGKVTIWQFFHLLSTLQYYSRSNHSGHACCYTNLNHLQHHLLCASLELFTWIKFWFKNRYSYYIQIIPWGEVCQNCTTTYTSMY